MSALDSLNEKIELLEKKIKKLEKQTSNFDSNYSFSVYTNNFLNMQVLHKKHINLKTISNTNKKQLFIQIKIKLFNFSSQNVEVKLFADKNQIASETELLNYGTNEISISGTYLNTLIDEVKIYIEVIPKSNKALTINSVTQTTWGDTQENHEDYSASESESDYLLSYIYDDKLYYKQFVKFQEPDDYDFIFCRNAISHSSCYFKNNFYIFYVGQDNNLFFLNLTNSSENFIAQNVSKVSCSVTDNSMVFSYISNGNCYYGEIQNNVVISNKQITSIHSKFIETCIYYNPYNAKCYLIITNTNGGNYILESIKENFSSSENICANISLTLETLEDSQ